jgi:hypothetical protein
MHNLHRQQGGKIIIEDKGAFIPGIPFAPCTFITGAKIAIWVVARPSLRL